MALPPGAPDFSGVLSNFDFSALSPPAKSPDQVMVFPPPGLQPTPITVPQRRDPPFFIVTAADKLRPFSDYQVAVTMVGTAQPVSVTVGLYGTERDNTFIKTSVIKVEPNSTQLVTFQIKDVMPDEYNLSIQGDEYFKFEQTSNVRFVDKYQSIFIQTDRAMYKPGHKVQFRVLVLDSNLRPSNQSRIDITVKDGQNNRVKEWKRVEAIKGMYSSDMQLSTHPIIGDWMIIVKSGGKEVSKKFTVAEYVLPKFEVLVDVPQHATYANAKVPVVVSAKYTYGQPVKGEATIKVRPQYTFFKEEVIENAKIITVDPVGKTEIDLVHALNLEDNQFYERTLTFDVAFKEDLTGKVLNGTAALKLHHAKCRVDFQKILDYLTPGDVYKTYLKVSNWDDTPFVGTKGTPVRVRYGKGWAERESAPWKDYQLPSNGLIELNFQTDDNTEVLNIEVEYMGVTAYDTVVKKQMEEGRNSSMLDLTVLNDKPKIGDTLEVDVFTKGDAPFLLYQLLGRNEMIEHKIMLLAEGQSTVRLKIPVGQTMAPDSHILLVYISTKGELVAAEKELQIENFLHNYVKLAVSPKETEPGKETVISVESKPNSLIALMGVDQSVLLLKKGNDFTREDVETDLRNYDSPWYGGRSWGKKRRSTFGWFPGYSARDVFGRAGAIIMTNAYIPEEKMPVMPAGGVLFGCAANVQCMSAAASPYDMASCAKTAPEKPQVQIRTKFPETWIWNSLDIGPQGKTSIRKIVPDTITSWIISGFSLSPEYGLGMSEDPAQLKVFRPFFISLNLPYSVTRDEVMIFPVNVFNYMDREVKADVTLENPGWFNFSGSSSIPGRRKKRDEESSRTKTVSVGSNSAATVNFMITPKQIGYLELKVTARSSLAGDGVSRKLLVKPEGETQYRTKGIFVDLREKNDFMADVELDIPADIVPDSELIEVSAVGDLMGSTLQNLDKLIRQPYGCGEQNMLNFVPNIVILDYLKSSHQLNHSIESKALKYLEMGYQRELTYKHKDNAYSAFGEADKSGSTWLTAFVAKSFKQAQKFIDIELSAIVEPLRWLASKQNRNGSFPEVGNVIHKQMQGGGSSGLALTAYVLTAFVETMTLTDEFRENIDRAVRYINEQIERGNMDVYSVAVAASALNYAGHPAKDKAFNQLESKSKLVGDLKWWEKDKEKEKDVEDYDNPWNTCIPNAINVEITAYALGTYLNRNMVSEAVPILRWLISQQNSEGGFASTQDTVVALGVIAKFAKKFNVKAKDMSINFEYPPGGSTKLKVNHDNALLLQRAELPSNKVRHITVDAKGTGFAVVQISYRYNVAKTGVFPLFSLVPKVQKGITKDHLLLDVTSSYTGGKESNMVVMEVVLPSGFTIDDEGIKALKMNAKIKRVETRDDDTVVVLYFDKMTSEKLSALISAYRSFKVVKQRPVPVTMYDYYDNSRRATEFYSPNALEICEQCESDDCIHCDLKV